MISVFYLGFEEQKQIKTLIKSMEVIRHLQSISGVMFNMGYNTRHYSRNDAFR